MKIKAASIGLLLFLQNLSAITGTKWEDLIIQTPNTGFREITLTEDSTLNITTSNAPILDQQYYENILNFNGANLLTLNIDIQGAMSSREDITPIYWIDRNNTNALKSWFVSKGGAGYGQIVFNVDATKTAMKRIMSINWGTLTIDQGVTLNLKENSTNFSAFHTGEQATLEFDSSFIADLRQSKGSFTNPKIQGKRNVILEHYGVTTKINTYKDKKAIVQMYGDIISAGWRLEVNLLNPQSVFEGHIDIGDSPILYSENIFELDDQAQARINLSFLPSQSNTPQRFTLNLSNRSSSTIDANLSSHYSMLDFNLNHSTLYANLSYNLPTGKADKNLTRIALNNHSSWMTTTPQVRMDEIYFNTSLPDRPKPDALSHSTHPSPHYFASKGPQTSYIDLRYSDFDGTLRSLPKIDSSNRVVLENKSIHGVDGVFKLYGILNRNLWGKDEDGSSIATDQIITQNLNGTHYIQLYWDTNTLDPALMDQNLIEDNIIVAKLINPTLSGDFIGASTPLGLYDYTTPLKRLDLMNAAGEKIGYKWVIGDLTPAPPPTPTPPPKPSFLAKTLNSLLTSSYKLFLFESETLHQRMGDLRYFDSVGGSYVKMDYALINTHETKEAISSLSMDTRITLGGDYGFYSYGGRGFLGLAFNVGVMQDFGGEFEGSKEAYHGDNLSYGLSVYQTTMFDSGFYIDAVMKYILGNHHYALTSPELMGEAFSFISHSLLASFEVGYKMRLPIPTPHFDYNFYYIKPQFNLIFGSLFGSPHFQFDAINPSKGESYKLDAKMINTIPVSPSVSFDLGRRFDHDEVLGDVFITLGAEYTFNAGNSLKMSIAQLNQSRIFEQEDVFNLKLGVGGNLIFQNGSRLYYSLNSKFLGRIQPLLDLNIGFRIPLGGKFKRIHDFYERGGLLEGVEVYGN